MAKIRSRKPGTDSEKFVTVEDLNPGDEIIDPFSGVVTRVAKIERGDQGAKITYDEQERPTGREGVYAREDWILTRRSIVVKND